MCPTTSLNTDIIFNSIVNAAPDIPIHGYASIRQVIQSFQWSASRIQNTEKVMANHRYSLNKTIAFLKICHYDKYLDLTKVSNAKKKIVASLIYDKIKSLLPQVCGDCNAQYNIPLDDPLSHKRRYCHLCGNPSHDCHDNKITQNSKFLAWLCPTCYFDHGSISRLLEDPTPSCNPPSDSLSTQPPLPQSQESDLTLVASPSPPSSRPPSVTESETPNEVTDDSQPSSSNSDSLSESVNSDTNETNINLNEHPQTVSVIPESLPENLDVNTNVTRDRTQTSQIAENSQSNIASPQPLPITHHTLNPHPNNFNESGICFFLRKGMCKHGISGTKNGVCPDAHPTVCLPYLYYGTRAKGCQKGSSCLAWHPSYICPYSVSSNRCMKANCKWFHQQDCARPLSLYNNVSKPHPPPHFQPRNPHHMPPYHNYAMKQHFQPSRRIPALMNIRTSYPTNRTTKAHHSARYHQRNQAPPRIIPQRRRTPPQRLPNRPSPTPIPRPPVIT